uniref:Integrase catalytic domain-containing protein n=1 Tax=Gongylonema pulchrum TaxID=637853 RepID=A0A183EY70_9BILA
LEYIEKLRGEERVEEESRYRAEAESEAGFIQVLEEGRAAAMVELQSQEDIIRSALLRMDANSLPAENSDNGLPTPVMRNGVQNVRLPKIELKPFMGNPKDWPQFWALFEAAVDSQPIPPVQKLTYLMGCLKDRAYRAVAGYSANADNYAVVLNVLKRRFGDVDIIRHTLHDELKNLKAVDNTRGLRDFVETMERILVQLENMGENIDLQHVDMMIKSKLPRWALLELYEAKIHDKPWNL